VGRGGRALLVVAATLLAAGCHRSRAATCRDVAQRFADGPTGEITRENAVAQEFVPDHDDLSGVKVLMATWGRHNRCEIIVRVRRAGVEADMANARFACAQVKDNDWVRLDFPPVSDSRGKRFLVSVESPDGAAGNALTAWKASLAGIYPDGTLFVGGRPTPGALAFETLHRC